MSALGELVKSERVSRGLTRIRVVQRGGVGYSTLAALEDGRARYLGVQQITQIAKGICPEDWQAFEARLWMAIPPEGRDRKYIPVTSDGEGRQDGGTSSAHNGRS